MAVLIRHHYNKNNGNYITQHIAILKETAKQYRINSAPLHGDYRDTIPKSSLNTLHPGYDSNFNMYSLEENIPHFKELVIAELEKRVEGKKKDYDNAVEDLRRAGK